MLRELLLIVAVSALGAECGSLQPVDDVDDGLKNLQAYAQSMISQGEYNVNNIVNISTSERFALWTEEEQAFYSNLDVTFKSLQRVKDLAAANDADIGVCLQWRESVIQNLLVRCNSDLDTCVTAFKDEVEDIQATSLGKIEEIKAEVASFSVRAKLCNGDKSCLGALITEINSFQTNLLGRVTEEVNRVDKSVRIRNLRIQNCMDTALAYLLNTAADCLTVITTCARDIIGY